MKITVVAVGKTTTGYIKDAVEAYFKRIGHYMPAEFVTLPDIKSTRALDATQQKEREGQALLTWLSPSDRLVLLDERGTQLTSRGFAEEINRYALGGTKRLVFAIGGPYGFSPDVYARAEKLLGLSKMTFSHEMVRLFIAEQIYRAMTILRGEPYHHD